MLPIYKGFDVKNLKRKNDYRSRIYGLILYTRRNPFVVKALKDDDFWLALNDESGPNWPIFAISPSGDNANYFSRSSDTRLMEMMVNISNDPDENNQFIDFFNLNGKEDLPCIIFFIWDDNEKLQMIKCPIIGNSSSQVYRCISKYVNCVANAESNILDEYKQSENLFREVKKDLEALNIKYRIIRGSNIISNFLDFISHFR